MSNGSVESVLETFGESVFSIKTMRNYLSEAAYESLRSTICQGKSLDPTIADEVADAMKTWAMEQGATHYTHWFQPLTGATAEKHDSFLSPDGEGGALATFAGKSLIQGEPDASSFPSGGIRATFEARGYTAWDPTSPAFIRKVESGATLCIPTVFCSYHGESLDKKTPLLRSMNALSKQVCRLGRLFGIEDEGNRAYATLGSEQEYFLIDLEFFGQRLDLIQTGRTLFGRAPAKHQQLDDHYFGAIRSRVLSFMDDLDRRLWRLGIPAKTRHNEVCPAQFEIAPMFEELNLAVDHNMMTMDVLRETAEEHGFACLLHEKPFAGVNGSGKHNNWAVAGPDGKNWLTPGDSPHENAKFLTMICSLMMAVDRHAPLLRATVASAGNDHRLGANEAPPAIISIFLGEQLLDVIDQLATGGAKQSKEGGTIEIGVSSLPLLPRDATDRNRTSPFAFTGNKFEFRAVGSSMSCAGPNVVLNSIVAEALDEVCTQLEADVAAGKDFNESLQELLKTIVEKHRRILFDGDNYTQEWQEEAEKRGLANLRTTPEALKEIVSEQTIALFKKYGVLSDRELHSRYEVYSEAYHEAVAIEGRVAAGMARTMILPVAAAYQAELADTINGNAKAGVECKGLKTILEDVAKATDAAIVGIGAVEARLAEAKPTATLSAMLELRTAVDTLESLLPSDMWPLPSYAEMMFVM